MSENCIVCTHKKLYNIIDNFNICFNCFHVNNQNANQKNINNKNSNQIKSNESIYDSDHIIYLLNEIGEIIEKKSLPHSSKLNILSINGKDTFILDKISEKFKFNVNTFSISENFNPSYFSSHKCYKYSLKTYCENFNDDSFDIILLNDTLSYTNDPIDILNKCKILCNKDTSTEAKLQSRQGTQIYSINLHTTVLLSLNYINIDKDINNIFNTNSMKTLCENTKFTLNDCIEFNNLNFQMYKLDNNGLPITNKKIIEFLYNEITIGLYNIFPYYNLKNYWNEYLKTLNTIFDKYRTKNYTIIGINEGTLNAKRVSGQGTLSKVNLSVQQGTLPKVNLSVQQGTFNNDKIKIDKFLTEEESISLAKNLGSKYLTEPVGSPSVKYLTEPVGSPSVKYVFVILNYTKYQSICDTLNNYLKSKNHLVFDIDNLIVE